MYPEIVIHHFTIYGLCFPHECDTLSLYDEKADVGTDKYLSFSYSELENSSNPINYTPKYLKQRDLCEV